MTSAEKRKLNLVGKAASINTPYAKEKDPEPLTILMLILAGLSAVGAWASFGAFKKRMTDEDRAEAQRHIFSANRALRRLKIVRDELFSILEEHELLYSLSSIGGATIAPDRIATAEMRRLRREIGQIVDRYASEIESLVSILGNEANVEKILYTLKEIDAQFRGLIKQVGEDKYINMLQGITELIDKQIELIELVAHIYDLRTPSQ